MVSEKNQLRYEITAALGVAILIFVSYRLAGALGVGLLGVLIMFIAVQADLNKSETSTVWAMRGEPPHRMDHAERAARAAESDALRQPIQIGKWLGAVLAVIGLGSFFFR